MKTPPQSTSLDPEDWTSLRKQGHQMLDDMFDYLEHIRSRPVWQPIPSEVRANFREPLPQQAMNPPDVYPYKQPQMEKVFAAFRAMLLKAAGEL